MQNKINSSLSITGFILFLICYPVYLIWKNFNVEQLINLWESIIEYKYWILLVVIVHLLIILRKILPIKKQKILDLFFLRRTPIVTIIIFIYPFLPDFQHRFVKINENNVTDFYAIFLPIFIMFIITTLMNTNDPDFLNEMKDSFLIKWNTSRKINSLVLKASKSIIILAYSFLFMLLVWWMCRTGKVNSDYETTFGTYPLAFFCFFFGISLLLNTILDNKPGIKISTKSNSTNTHKNKDKKEDINKNIKVNFE